MITIDCITPDLMMQVTVEKPPAFHVLYATGWQDAVMHMRFVSAPDQQPQVALLACHINICYLNWIDLKCSKLHCKDQKCNRLHSNAKHYSMIELLCYTMLTF